jgi:hypothetical protein
MMVFPSNIKVRYWNFTPEEVRALYRLIIYMGWMPRKDDEITAVVNRICKIAQSDELATTDNQTA